MVRAAASFLIISDAGFDHDHPRAQSTNLLLVSCILTIMVSSTLPILIITAVEIILSTSSAPFTFHSRAARYKFRTYVTSTG